MLFQKKLAREATNPEEKKPELTLVLGKKNRRLITSLSTGRAIAPGQ
jgi:hypothetical protein